MSAGSELTRHSHNVVVSPCRETTGTEGEAVMRVWNSVEEPTDILGSAHDARQPKDGNGRVVGVDTHVHPAFLACRHDSFEEILHVGLQLRLVDAFVEIQELVEKFQGMFVVLAEIAADKALCLDDDILYELVVALGRHGLGQSFHFGK